VDPADPSLVRAGSIETTREEPTLRSNAEAIGSRQTVATIAATRSFFHPECWEQQQRQYTRLS